MGVYDYGDVHSAARASAAALISCIRKPPRPSLDGEAAALNSIRLRRLGSKTGGSGKNMQDNLVRTDNKRRSLGNRQEHKTIHLSNAIDTFLHNILQKN